MKKIGWVLSLAVILFPTFVSADCADLGRYTSWILETSHTVLFYDGETPLARVEIPYCEITHCRRFGYSTVMCVTRMRLWWTVPPAAL
jgi:hypothetical protein